MADKFLALCLNDPKIFLSSKRILSFCSMLMKLASNICSCVNDENVSLNLQKHCESSVILTIRIYRIFSNLIRTLFTVSEG